MKTLSELFSGLGSFRKVVLAGGMLMGLPAAVPTAYAQTNTEVYGQNRIQLRRFDWRFFETEHFRIYHYDAAGRQLARYVSEQAERDIAFINKNIGGKLPKKIHIIVYNNYDEYQQTNIGRKIESQLNEVNTGNLDNVDDRVVVYFTGVHSEMHRQMLVGMSQISLERLLTGSNFKDRFRSTASKSLPSWVKSGYIAYIVDGWDATSENQWKNLLAAYPKRNYYQLAEEHPELAGKAFWKYISSTYGDENVKNLVYAIHVNNNLKTAFQSSLASKPNVVQDSCMAFYKQAFARDAEGREQPDSATALIKIPFPKGGEVISNFKVSPMGRDIAYTTFKDGVYKVYLQHTASLQAKAVLLETGTLDYNDRVPDPDFPLLAWSNTGTKLAIIYRENGKTLFRVYNSQRAKIERFIIPKNRIDRITGVTFLEDDRRMIFTGIKKSQSDLYEYTFKGNKFRNITNDAWDESMPQYVSGGTRKGIIFLSNRTAPNLNVPISVNQLPVGSMNMFFYNTHAGGTRLLQLSDINKGKITQPIQYGSDNFAFLYDSAGIQNKYVVLFKRISGNRDSAFSVPVSNYAKSIIAHQYNPASNQVAEVMADSAFYKVYFKPLYIPELTDPVRDIRPTLLSRLIHQSEVKTKFKIPEKRNITRLGGATLKSGNTFRSEFDNEQVTGDNNIGIYSLQDDTVKPAKEEKLITLPEVAEDNEVDSTYVKMRAQPYRIGFRPDILTLRFDNTVLFQRYQPVAFNNGRYTNPDLSGLMCVSLNDVLENHRVTGGIRIPASLNLTGLTYFLQYENVTNRVDWNVMYLRSANINEYNVSFVDTIGNVIFTKPEIGKTSTNIIQGSASYPFNRRESIRMTLGGRYDQLNFKAQDSIALRYIPREHQSWLMSRAEYVYDNSYSPVLNIRKGIRFKVFAEYMYQLNNSGGGMYNLGTDFRYYHKVHKNIIWANRFSYAYSDGKQKILYYLGGVDNWLLPQFDNTASANPGMNYGFQAIATNLRGYRQGARNGNSYVMVNEEMRVPLSTFFRRPLQSGILKHMQFVVFADAGAAWTGFWPNKETVKSRVYLGPDPQSPNTVLILEQPDKPAVAFGFGPGVRTMVLGYFLRVDVAWNTEGSTKPMIHVGLGTDF